MNHRICVVVGDDYASFAGREGVVTISSLMKKLALDGDVDLDRHFIIGQGMEEHARRALVDVLREKGASDISPIAPLSPLSLTHKRAKSNVLITEPQWLTLRKYRFEFAVGDVSDRLSDHVTGQHVGAMLLMEAARQAGVASIECEWILGDSCWGFILETFNAKFENYAFPLPTQITVTLDEKEKSDKQIWIGLQIDFHQAGKRISEMQLIARLYKSAVLEKIEKRSADQAIAVLAQSSSGAGLARDLAC